MKKIVAIIAVAGMLSMLVPSGAYAGGDHGWATVGKVLTGFIGLSILGNAIANPYPAYYGPPPRAYYAPPAQVWVPGHYESRFDRYWVRGHWEYRGSDYDDDDGYGARGGRVWIPGHYEANEVQVWIPGHWEG